MPISKLGWYARRLQVMSASEVLWRASDQVKKLAWEPYQVRRASSGTVGPIARAAQRTPTVVGRPRFAGTLPMGAAGEVPPAAQAATVAAADRLMTGHWEILGVERTDMEAPDWFYDPLTGKKAPGTPYAFRINHRREDQTGNVKQIWELSRHHHLTVLAAAYAFTADKAYAERAAEHLSSWWDQNPFLSGINWTSGIEAGIRLISWAWVRRLLEGWDGAPALFEDNPSAQEQIWWHQRYLAAFRSRGSSANNHVIAEAAGQLVGALAFDWFRESDKWATEAAKLLEAELERNTYSSGVNREMAFEYHGLVAELGLLAAAEADRAGRPLTESTWGLLRRMTDVVAATVDEALGAPRYGDGDDGKALVLDPAANPWESLLSTGRVLFDAAGWWPVSAPDGWSTLVGALAAKHPSPAYERASERPDRFEDAGLTLLRTVPEAGSPEIWCRADAGPHGFMAIAAHAHADALSVEVRHGGIEILADPGTYCYHGERKWRSYFRSSLAHNTVELGGRDQSTSGGPFLWLRHAKAREITPTASVTGAPSTDSPATGGAEDELQVWTAEHDGYQVLTPPATHRRTVRLRPSTLKVEIVDEIVCAGAHPLRLAFHFGPAVSVELEGTIAQLSWVGRDGTSQGARMVLPAAQWRLARGEEKPVLGWYSARFGIKQPACSLVGEATTADAPLVTEIDFAAAPGSGGPGGDAGPGAANGRRPNGGDGQ